MCLYVYVYVYVCAYVCAYVYDYICTCVMHVCVYSLSLPTLLISECVLIYLKPADAKAVVTWASTFFTGWVGE